MPPSKIASHARPATPRMTRLRATKEEPAPDTVGRKPSGLLAKGKKELRKVSDKIKDKDKDTVVTSVTTEKMEAATYSESLQV